MKSSMLTDSEIVSRIKNSDPAAFKMLFFKYHDSLINFAFLKTKNEEIAKDSVQETFAKLWISRENLDASKSIKNYLYSICSNTVVNIQRKENFLKIDFQVDQNELKGSDYETDITLERQSLRSDIEKLLTSLSEPIRIVFSMSRFDDMKYSEIADSLGISVKTVEARMSKALVFFRKNLKHYL